MSGAKSFGILIDPGGGVGGTDRVIGLALSITRDLSRLAVDDGDLSRLPRRAVGRAADHVRPVPAGRGSRRWGTPLPPGQLGFESA